MFDSKEKFERRMYEQGDTIFEEGQPGTAAYLLISGKVNIGLGMKGESPRILATLEKGKILGEMALFDKHPRMASAIAVEKTEAIRISREEFRGRLNSTDPVMRSVLTIMVKRIRDLSKELADLKRTDWRSG